MKTVLEYYPNIKKLISILANMDRGIPIGSNAKDCQKTVFIRRTLGKWLNHRIYKISRMKGTGLYKPLEEHEYESDEIKVKFIEYFQVWNIKYYLGYGEELSVNTFEPHSIDITKKEIISFHSLQYLEIEEDRGQFNAIQQFYK